ncbi:MAG: M20/M25/M40 family metallo-hydrolase [Negativicutes bacterium]|nr:M20/M25/M40 family metallo-hydrolase [Negativicutes bacterium]
MSKQYSLADNVTAAYEKLASCRQIAAGLAFLAADETAALVDQRAITEIPAPPFQETARAEYYRERLRGLGLKDVTTDREGNVFGVYKGTGPGPTLFVAAHLDTVFPAGTDTSVREEAGRLYAPGIADDSRGLAAILSVIRALNGAKVQTVGNIIFGGTVGEEGLGDLRGVKAFFRDNKNIDGFITVDGTKVGPITYLATGSLRYEITFQGPGGHSWNAFGLPSATHALGRAVAKIADLQTPQQPKTTFTVGTVTGGTSVNSIAAEATMLLDIRSTSQEELRKLEQTIIALVNQAADEENRRWASSAVSVNVKTMGDRPAGQQQPDVAIVQAAWASALAIGRTPELAPASSTDANLPINLGVPALRLGGGGAEGQNHSPGEWYDPAEAYLGPQAIFLTILGLVGVDGLTRPLLPSRKKRK